jgi:hypothetical protein
VSQEKTLLVHRSSPSQVGTVAERWKAQYCRDGKWGTTVSGSTEAIHSRLAALPTDATPDDVAAIIGNSSWTGDSCDGCSAYAPTVWQIGEEEPDYESSTVLLCEACMARLVEAYRALRRGSAQ